MSETPPVRIVGCGRWSMGDDQAGLAVAERLLTRNIPGTVVVMDEAPGSDLAVGLDEHVRLLVIIDAARANKRHPPGSFKRVSYSPKAGLVAGASAGGAHSLGVMQGLRLAEVLGVLPLDTRMYLLFGTFFQRGLTMGAETEAGIEALVDTIEADVHEWLNTRR